jgi:hypothetical protein
MAKLSTAVNQYNLAVDWDGIRASVLDMATYCCSAMATSKCGLLAAAAGNIDSSQPSQACSWQGWVAGCWEGASCTASSPCACSRQFARSMLSAQAAASNCAHLQ